MLLDSLYILLGGILLVDDLYRFIIARWLVGAYLTVCYLPTYLPICAMIPASL